MVISLPGYIYPAIIYFFSKCYETPRLLRIVTTTLFERVKHCEYHTQLNIVKWLMMFSCSI